MPFDRAIMDCSPKNTTSPNTGDGLVAPSCTPPQVRESTRTSNEQKARRFLKTREERVAAGQPILPRVDRIRYEEIRKDLEAHYEAHGTRDLAEFKRRVKTLDRMFTGRRVATISQLDADAYMIARQEQGMKPGTIRRELSTLVTMPRSAYESGKLLRLPILHKPKDGPARGGFFEPAQYAAACRRLPEDLRVATLIAYVLGWRTQSEILTLERRQVDLEAGALRLEPGTTKNDDGRIAYRTPELKAALAGRLERVKALERRLGGIVPCVFPHIGKGKRAGQPRRDFRKAWAAASKAAGVPGRYRHDFRRTAVRNMERAGVPRSVATKVTGHRTGSVYRRYAIVFDADLQLAARKMTQRANRFVSTVAEAEPPRAVNVRES